MLAAVAIATALASMRAWAVENEYTSTSSGVSTLTQAAADLRYLKLNADNDPITGALSLSARLDTAAHANSVGLNIPTNAGTCSDVTGSADGDVCVDTTANLLYFRSSGSWVSAGSAYVFTGGTVTGQTTFTADPASTADADATVRIAPATSAANDQLFIIEANTTDVFSVTASGAVVLTGTLTTSDTLQSSGQLYATMVPSSGATSGATVRIDAATANADEYLLAVMLGGASRFTVDEDGDVVPAGRVDIGAHGNGVGLNLPTNAGAPAGVTGTAEGDCVFDSTGDDLYCYDGAAFVQMNGGGAFSGGTASSQLVCTLDPASGATSAASLLINPATTTAEDVLFAIQDNAADLFSVDEDGDVEIAGRVNTAAHGNGVGLNVPTYAGTCADVTGSANGDLCVDTTNALLYYRGNGSWVASNAGASWNGGTVTSQVVLTADPASGAGADATLRIEPATAAANEYLLFTAVGGTERFAVDEDGDITTTGKLIVTENPVDTTDASAAVQIKSGSAVSAGEAAFLVNYDNSTTDAFRVDFDGDITTAVTTATHAIAGIQVTITGNPNGANALLYVDGTSGASGDDILRANGADGGMLLYDSNTASGILELDDSQLWFDAPDPEGTSQSQATIYGGLFSGVATEYYMHLNGLAAGGDFNILGTGQVVLDSWDPNGTTAATAALYINALAAAADADTLFGTADNGTQKVIIDVAGNITTAADVAVNGGDITTTSATLAIGAGASTSVTLGAATGVVTSLGIQIPMKRTGTGPTAPQACGAGYEGGIVFVDDTDDAAAAFLCFCGKGADDTTYSWQKVANPGTACGPF